MSSINLKTNIITTILSKTLILLLNFAVLVLTTQLWGADGKGAVAIFVADLSLISIFANVFTGCSVSYYFAKLAASKLSTTAYLWSFVVATAGACVLWATGEQAIAPFVFVTASLMGLMAFHNSLFLGGQKISYYNLITVLQPALLLLCMLLCYFWWPQWDYYCYFVGQTFSLALILLVCVCLRRKMGIRLHWGFDYSCSRQLFSYGWKSELGTLLQFFNYRLTYFILDYYIGRESLGVFSVGVTIAEAIWIVNRSMSMVQYSNVLKQGNTRQSRKETLILALISLGISAVCVLVIVFLPSSLFSFVFGAEFGQVNRVVLILSPGILAMAFSNVLDNYFSAIRHLNVQILKSAVVLVFTFALSLWLIPQYGIDGACVVNAASYVISAAILMIYFLSKKATRDIHE
ncbi:MAG: polysaccharide biosynthesis C-terminal domain-containing protein [Bacteroidales bacterium]|nr:polysaccharide biosynthesis C-terminal domain-containing protein [Bacteroidales bacterium]